MNGESFCAVCGEHANEHGAIPHQFVARSSKERVALPTVEDAGKVLTALRLAHSWLHQKAKK